MNANKRPELDRARVAVLLQQVLESGRTTDQLQPKTDRLTPAGREMFFGSLRFYFRLQHTIAQFLDRDPKGKLRIAYYLLIVGAYQLIFMRTAGHAAVFETVAAADTLRLPAAKGFINAVLRKLQAQIDADQLPPMPIQDDYPAWLVEALHQQFPDRLEGLLETMLTRAPMTLRVNARRSDPEHYRGVLADAGITFQDHEDPYRLTLAAPMASALLPGFTTGQVSVQDAGAQRVAQLLAEQCRTAGCRRVLDACAAPGGKAQALTERVDDLRITAVDRSPERLATMTAANKRLGHGNIEGVQGDATNTAWWDGEPFDAILADVPCSGTGTLRRHPDIKLLRTRESLTPLARSQLAIVSNLWRTLAPGGTLLYSTCSLLDQENDNVVERFLETVDDAVIHSAPIADHLAGKYGAYLLPGSDGGDGYYVALLRKVVKAIP